MSSEIHPFFCEDIAFQVISWSDVKSVARLANVCTHFSNLVRREEVWEVLAKKTILDPPQALVNMTWKDYVRKKGTIKIQLPTPQKEAPQILFSVEINLKSNLIIFFRKEGEPPVYGDDCSLKEVFHRIQGSFTLIQKSQINNYYYFRDLNSPISNVQFKIIDPDFNYYDIAWMKKFEECKAKLETKNFTFRLITLPLNTNKN